MQNKIDTISLKEIPVISISYTELKNSMYVVPTSYDNVILFPVIVTLGPSCT